MRVSVLHRVHLAIKCSQRPEALDLFLQIAKNLDLTALEIQEVLSIMQQTSMEDRAATVVSKIRGKITRLAYHQPLWGLTNTWEQAKSILKYEVGSFENSLAVELAKETIREAVEVGLQLRLKHPILINFHIVGYVNASELSVERKAKQLRHGEETLLKLKTFADELCFEKGFEDGTPQIRLVRENNYPYLTDEVYSILDSNPLEFTRLKCLGVNLDFAHFQMTMNYLKNHPSSVRSRIEAQLYPQPSWETAVKTIRDQLELVHLNDAKGDTPEYEGIQIGLGEIPFRTIIPMLCENLRRDIMGTVEIKDLHLHPEAFVNSVLELKKIFGEKFGDYFY